MLGEKRKWLVILKSVIKGFVDVIITLGIFFALLTYLSKIEKATFLYFTSATAQVFAALVVLTIAATSFIISRIRAYNSELSTLLNRINKHSKQLDETQKLIKQGGDRESEEVIEEYKLATIKQQEEVKYWQKWLNNTIEENTKLSERITSHYKLPVIFSMIVIISALGFLIFTDVFPDSGRVKAIAILSIPIVRSFLSYIPLIHRLVNYWGKLSKISRDSQEKAKEDNDD